MKLGPRPTGRPWTPADDAQLLALLASGLDRPSIARKLKRSVHAIASRKSHLNQGRLVEPVLKAEEMMASGLRELEEMAAKLEPLLANFQWGPAAPNYFKTSQDFVRR